MGKKGGKKEKTDDYSGHYVIASSRPPERRPLDRRMLVPIIGCVWDGDSMGGLKLATEQLKYCLKRCPTSLSLQ